MAEPRRGPKTILGVTGVLLGGLLLFVIFGITGAFVAGAVERHCAPWSFGPVLVFPGLIAGLVFIMAGFVVMVRVVARGLGLDTTVEASRDALLRAQAGLHTEEDNGHS